MDYTDQVRELMAATFGMDERELAGAVTQGDCPAWTSLAHLTLVLALEEHFGTGFSMDDMLEMTSLAKIVSALEERVVA